MLNRIVLLLGVLALVFASADGALRILDRAAPPKRLVPENPEIYRSDDRVAHLLWPSTRACHRHPPAGTRVQEMVSNSDGMRSSRELDEPDSRPRVLIVGDSFIFGLGVEADERISEVLEQSEPRWRVDSIAMPGWSVGLMIRAIETFGPKADPDVVVLAVYTDDLRRAHPYYAGIGYPFAKYALEKADLVIAPFAHPEGWQRWHLPQLFLRATRHRDLDFLELNRAILMRFLTLSREQDFRPLALFLPGRRDLDVDKKRRAFVNQWAAENDVPFLDLSEVIQTPGPQQTFLEGDFHWNSKGHRIAAAELEAFLTDNVQLLRDAPTPRQPTGRPSPGRVDHCPDIADETSTVGSPFRP